MVKKVMTKSKALKLIKKAYGTLNQNDVWSVAADLRVGNEHQEIPANGVIHCAKCGIVEEGTADPIWHPEQYLNE